MADVHCCCCCCVTAVDPQPRRNSHSALVELGGQSDVAVHIEGGQADVEGAVSLRGFAISIFYEIEVDDIADLKVFSMQNYRNC